jgi:hypothetical protein
MNVRSVVLSVACLAGGLAVAAEVPEAHRRAEAIVKRAEEASGRPFAPTFRASVVQALAGLSAEELAAREARDAGQGLGPLVIGDSSAQLVYTPVTPCRIIDTRPGAVPLQPGSVRNFRVTGIGLDVQGGSASGCNVPMGPATAAVINFVAVQATGPGNLRAWPFAGPVPTASIINYTLFPGLNLANGLVQPLCAAGAALCDRDIHVQADVSATHVVADVLGYFSQFPKASVRSFTIHVTAPAGSGTLPGGGGCSNAGGTSITLTAPVAGRVVVRGKASLRIQHLMGSSDEIWTAVGDSPTDCPSDFGHALVVTRIPSALPTFESAGGNLMIQAEPVRVFDVAAGEHTFYLNFAQLTGAGNDDATYRAMEATFHPN